MLAARYLEWTVLLLFSANLTPMLYAQKPPTAPAATQNLKAPLAGILSMGNIRFHNKDGGVPDNSLADLDAKPGVFDGLIVNFTWAQLEPKPGVVDTTPIEEVLAKVRAYNARNPRKPLRLGLRIWPGPNAPEWVKTLGGDPINVLHRGMPITVGRFWTKPYREAWRDLQNKLAAQFDSEPLIAQVTNSSGSTITDEPFIVPGDPTSIANLNKAGFSDSMFYDTRETSPEDYAAWKTTRIDYAINPYRKMNSGKPRADMALTLELVRSWRQKMGARGIIANHSLNFPPAENLIPIYDLIKQLGQPIEFQTHSPIGLNWDGAISYAISLGATAVELWPGIKQGGFKYIPVATLTKWSDELRANVKRR